MISVLLLTYNEETTLGACLEAIRWADDVLVVDSGSTDRTTEIARSFGARVLFNRFVNFAEQRNFGLQKGELKHDWVLHLDADEVVTPELRVELSRSVKASPYDAYRVAFKTMLEDRWLKYSGMYPRYQVRVGLRERLTFVEVGHGQREALPPERIGTLKEPLLHYSFSKGFQDWVERHNRYSTAEARHFLEASKGEPIEWRAILAPSDPTERRRALKRLFFHLPFRPTLRFLYMYVLRFGFLDGRAGLTYCRLLSIYEYVIVLKTREFKSQHKGGPKVQASG